MNTTLAPTIPAQVLRQRWRAAGFAVVTLCFAAGCIASLDLRWGALATPEAGALMARFAQEFARPALDPGFLRKILAASGETLAMSVLGTLMAAGAGAGLSLPAARLRSEERAPWRMPARLLLNALRSVPELVWAALLLVALGLGPMAGALALALHTSGVLGRLYAEALENAPAAAADALRAQGCTEPQVFLYATLPQVLPQWIAYTLYRWENNIRASTILGVVGAGGLGQMLLFHLGLFQMSKAATVLGAMLLLVLGTDLLSNVLRKQFLR